MAVKPQLRLYHKYRLEYVRTGSLTAFRRMMNHYDESFFTHVPMPKGNHSREYNERPYIMGPEGLTMMQMISLPHIHDHEGNCAKNRFGPRCRPSGKRITGFVGGINAGA